MKLTIIKDHINKINLSLVAYKTSLEDIDYFVNLISSEDSINTLYIVDNYGENKISDLIEGMPKVVLISGHGNVGYGAGHNLAIKKSLEDIVDYHLIVNPDVRFNASILETLISYSKNLKVVY